MVDNTYSPLVPIEKYPFVCFVTNAAGDILDRNSAFRADPFLKRHRSIRKYLQKDENLQFEDKDDISHRAVTLKSDQSSVASFVRKKDEVMYWYIPDILRRKCVRAGFREVCASYGFFAAEEKQIAGNSVSSAELFAYGVEETIRHYVMFHAMEYDRFRTISKTAVKCLNPEAEITFSDELINAPLIEVHKSYSGLGRLLGEITEKKSCRIRLERNDNNELTFVTENGQTEAGKIRYYLHVSEPIPKTTQWEDGAIVLAGLSSMELFLRE